MAGVKEEFEQGVMWSELHFTNASWRAVGKAGLEGESLEEDGVGGSSSGGGKKETGNRQEPLSWS